MSREFVSNLYSEEGRRNPYPILRELVACGPLVRAKFPLVGRVWMVTTHEAVNELLKDRKHFVRDAKNLGRGHRGIFPFWMPRTLRVMMMGMIMRDEPDHRRLRRLVEQAFARRSLEQMQPRMEAIADELIQEMKQQHRSTGQPVDLISLFAQQFPLAVIAELLGLPEADRPVFTRWAQQFAIEPSWLAFLKIAPALGKIESYLRNRIRECRQNPRVGLLTELVRAEEDGQKLSEDELVAMAVLLLFAGHMTTTHLIGNGIYEFFRHPDQAEIYFADGADKEAGINEILRHTSPVQMTKPIRVAESMTWNGFRLKKGETLMAVLSAANVDPAVFAEPEKFDVMRAPNPHLAFGAGIHVCLGLKLAKQEARIAFDKLWHDLPGLKPASPLDDLAWSRQKGIRGPRTFPVTFSQAD